MIITVNPNVPMYLRKYWVTKKAARCRIVNISMQAYKMTNAWLEDFPKLMG